MATASLNGELNFNALAREHYPGHQLKADVLEGLCSLGYWEARKNQTWGLAWHQNEGIEITYLDKGCLPFSVEQQHCDLQQKWATVTKPWERHRVGNPHVTPSKLYWLILDVGVRRPHDPWFWPTWIVLNAQEKLILRNILDEPDQHTFIAPAEMVNAFYAIEACLNDPEPQAHESRIKLCINEIFLCLCNNGHPQTPTRDDDNDRQKTVNIFLKHLKKCPQEAWSLVEMADECGLGKSQFIKYTRDITNMSPMDYLQQCRLELACQMIRNDSKIALTRVAFDCGFSSSAYFSTVFRKFKGLSPTEFFNTIHKRE